MTRIKSLVLAALSPVWFSFACSSAGPGSGMDSGTNPACPASTVACGTGCIPLEGVCCDTGAKTTSSYCTNIAGGGCLSTANRSCVAAFSFNAPAEFCCAQNSLAGSNDCATGHHHCGLQCRTTPCSGFEAQDAGTDGGNFVDGGAGGGGSDPCQVIGTWSAGCPSGTGCGSCGAASSWSETFVIDSVAAENGGVLTSSAKTFTFNVSTCTVSVVPDDDPNAALCGNPPGQFALDGKTGTGTGQTTFYCWSGSACNCTWDRPSGSCTATRN